MAGGGDGGLGRESVLSWLVKGLARAIDGLLGGVLRERERDRERGRHGKYGKASSASGLIVH